MRTGGGDIGEDIKFAERGRLSQVLQKSLLTSAQERVPHRDGVDDGRGRPLNLEGSGWESGASSGISMCATGLQGGTLTEALYGREDGDEGKEPEGKLLTWNKGGLQLALRIVRGVVQLHAVQVSPALGELCDGESESLESSQ